MTIEHGTMDRDTMLALGLIFPVAYGIQIDLNVVWRRMPDGTKLPASLCDHNCTREVGGYECPAAFTLNKGAKPSFATAEEILFWIEAGHTGLQCAREVFLKNYFPNYLRDFRIPAEVGAILAEALLLNGCEVNLFGGNPEMHPEIAKLIHRLKANGFRVNLTTTGRRFLSSEKFIERFALDPPHLLALSADDFDPERLEELFEMPLRGLKAAWKRIDPRHGQEQKFVESIYAARLVQERGIDTELLFNMVLHHGNLRHVRQMMDAIRRYIPAAIVNPYPAQDSFSGGPGDLFSAEDVAEFGGLADFFIQETLSGNPNLAKNIHYWIAMAAVLESCRSDPASASRFIAGHRVWQCYRREPAMGAGMYLQIGKANAAFVQAGFSDGAASGHAGCYWNSQTVTSSHEIRSFREVSRYLLGGMQHLAENASPRCPGCSMPRLWFNMVTTELGLNPGLRKKYFELRKSYVGF